MDNKLPPNAYGFRMPAEWTHHEATWLAWPHEQTDWPGKFENIPWIYGDIVRHLARHERVNILTENEDAVEGIRNLLKKCDATLDAVTFHPVQTNRSWTRDFCPTFLRNSEGSLAAVDWSFNGWSKYDNAEHDNAVGEELARRLDLQTWRPVFNGKPVVLEGGSIEVNGVGALITTEECLLSDVQVRNPGMTRADYERLFSDYLGVTHTIWLKRGIAGDDTHGHVDDLVRFIDPHSVVTVIEENMHDANYQPLQENFAILRESTDHVGRPLLLHTLPMPDPIYFDGQRLPASYANFYIANHVVLVPVFNDRHDRFALNTIAGLFPEHEVIPIYSRDLVLGLGTLHCMTQQQPV
jgi:agmatine deiminase